MSSSPHLPVTTLSDLPKIGKVLCGALFKVQVKGLRLSTMEGALKPLQIMVLRHIGCKECITNAVYAEL